MIFSESMNSWWRSKKAYIFPLLLIVGLLLVLLRSYVSQNEGGRHFFKIARDISWYPLDLLGKEKNMQGFTGELILDVAIMQNWRFGFIDVGQYNLMDGLDNGSYDAVISSITPTLIQEEYYLFSDSIYPFGPVLIVSIDSSFHSLNEMEGKIIEVGPETLQVFNTTKKPIILFSVAESDSQMLDHLLKGSVDGVIMDAFKAYSYVQGAYAHRLKVATNPITDRGLRLMMIKNPQNRQFIEQFNQGLKKLIEDGTYEKLVLKWGLFLTEKKKE